MFKERMITMFETVMRGYFDSELNANEKKYMLSTANTLKNSIDMIGIIKSPLTDEEEFYLMKTMVADDIANDLGNEGKIAYYIARIKSL